MTDLTTVAAGTGAITDINDNFTAVSAAGVYGRRAAGVAGLTWGFYGGRSFSNTIANGTVALTASTTNYVVANRTTGAVSNSTATTNWNDTANYYRLYLIVTGASSITTATDYREFTGGASLSGTAWGSITGTLSSQTDLAAALALKQNRSPSVQAVTSSATVTPTFSDDAVKITAQAVNLTLANPTGTAIDSLGMTIRIKDNGTARAINYGTQYRAIGVSLPSTTVISKTLYIAMIFNSEDTKWDVVAVGQEP